MLLIYSDPAREPAWGTPEFQSMMAEFFSVNERMKADGTLRGGDGLNGVETATSRRMRSGKVETMHGPFAETREHLGGYSIVDVPDLDAALTYAARFGTVKVRPVMDCNPASA